MATEFKPHIGKNVIETLTLGMYEDPRFVFREYIQNAADQIDIASELGILNRRLDGQIEITIDKEDNSITVFDNATGIQNENVLQFLGDVANSQKDRKERKGFRGIGRLGGLGYCDQLVFETSAVGEDLSTVMTLDAKQLKELILDNNVVLDAATVISLITTIDTKPEAIEEHYFKIFMTGVQNSRLLDIAEVEKYLSMVAPIPFSPDFKFATDIKGYYNSKNVFLDEYEVTLNGTKLFKAYKNNIEDEENLDSELLGVDFFEIRDDESELLGLGWYGFRKSSNIVLPPSNFQRGIRLRKSNIALGDDATLDRFFKASTTNKRFIGEVHAVHVNFIPNARRDYFNDNKTTDSFESSLEKIFKIENLENRIAHNASRLFNRLKDIEDFKNARDEFESRKGSFSSKHEEQLKAENLKKAEEKAKAAVKEISRIKVAASSDKAIEKLYTSYVSTNPLDVQSAGDLVISNYDPPTFSLLNEAESNVAREIITIIEENLPVNQAKMIKTKIIQYFNK